MLCVIDVGNSHTVLGLYDGRDLVHSWRLRTDPQRTTDEWALMLRNLLELSKLSMTQITALAVSSVVPPAISALRRMGQNHLDIEPLLVGPGTKTGLPINYDNPKEVGADRVVNAVAAFERLQAACIVVDFGTATTFDCISEKGEYLGGAICPGIGISLDALVSRAAKLPRVEIALPRRAVGRNTVESMQSGLFYGYVALVDGLVGRLTVEMGCEPRVIATGGLAGALSEVSEAIETVDHDLTLEGLRIIYERNPR